MNKPILTHDFCRAAAQDAGGRAMRKAGRSTWNDDDWNVASAEYARLTVVLLEEKESTK